MKASFKDVSASHEKMFVPTLVYVKKFIDLCLTKESLANDGRTFALKCSIERWWWGLRAKPDRNVGVQYQLEFIWYNYVRKNEILCNFSTYLRIRGWACKHQIVSAAAKKSNWVIFGPIKAEMLLRTYYHNSCCDYHGLN